MASKGRGDGYWVTQRDDGRWGVKRPGSDRASGVFGTQRDAIERGRELAQGARTELIVQGRNGGIRSKDSYGNDPLPPRDREH